MYSQCFYTNFGGQKVLENCDNRREVVEIENGAVRISSKAFDNLPAKKIVLPDSVETIDGQAILKCHNLQKIVFGKNLSDIEPEAIQACHMINEIVFPEDSVMMCEIAKFVNSGKGETGNVVSLLNLLNSLISRDKKDCISHDLTALKQFFADGIPRHTIRFTVGNKSVMLSRFVREHDVVLVRHELTEWIGDAACIPSPITCAYSLWHSVGVMSESFLINKDPAAMAYLDNLQLLKIMSEKLGSNSVIRLIDGNLFANPERIRQVLDMFVQNNMMTEAAALLEKAKNKNIKINNFDL